MAVHIEVWEFREGSYFKIPFLEGMARRQNVDEHLRGGWGLAFQTFLRDQSLPSWVFSCFGDIKKLSVCAYILLATSVALTPWATWQ